MIKDFFKNIFPQNDLPPLLSEQSRIAILEPNDSPAVEKIRHGFISKLTSSGSNRYVLDIQNAFGKKENIPLLVNEILSKPVDLIFVIGADCTKALKEETARRNKRIPIVFADVKDPVESKFINSFVSSQTNMTGVVSFNHDFHTHIRHLLTLLPEIKRALLVYDPSQESGLIKREVQEIMHLLNTKGVEGDIVEAYDKQEIELKVSNYLSHTKPDVVIPLRDSTTLGSISKLVEICNSHRIPLYTQDLESVLVGATFGSGFSDRQTGEEAAKMAHQICEDKYDPAHIPISLLHEEYRVRVNSMALGYLGIKLSKETLLWLSEHGEFI